MYNAISHYVCGHRVQLMMTLERTLTSRTTRWTLLLSHGATPVTYTSSQAVPVAKGLMQEVFREVKEAATAVDKA